MTEKYNVSKVSLASNATEMCYFVHVVIFDKEDRGLFLTSIITVVINGVFALIATMGNSIFILTLCRTPSLRTPSNTLLGNLALSDLLVGTFVQPLYVWYKAGEVSGNYSCYVHISFSTVAWIAVGISFLTLISISLERYMAIFKSFLYVSMVQETTICLVSAFIWALALMIVFARFYGLKSLDFNITCLAIILTSFTTTIIIYVKIYRVAKQHQRSIRDQAQTTKENTTENACKFAQETKLSKTVGLITGLFFLSYLPTLFIMGYYSINGYSTLVKTLYSWTDTIVFLNSSLNPVVYYLRNRSIRRAVLKLLLPLKTGLPCFNSLPQKNNGATGEADRSIGMSKKVTTAWKTPPGKKMLRPT